MIGGRVGMQFKIDKECGRGWSQEVYPERESGGIVCGWQLEDLGLRLW